MPLCRAQEMDLKLGCAFTRFQTKYFQGKYGDLDTNLVSYGPCQTPTLWFCVRRSDEINSFQPESYYTIDASISKAGRDLDLQWDRGQVFDMPVASLFMSLLQDNAKALVTEISQKEDRMARPQALNTVAMLKMASTRRVQTFTLKLHPEISSTRESEKDSVLRGPKSAILSRR